MIIERKKLIFIVVGIFILATVIFLSYKNPKKPELEKDPFGHFITREIIKEKYDVPEKDTTNLPENIARPTQVFPGVPVNNQPQQSRAFNILIENDKFFPDTIIVNDWDDIVLYVKAIDKDYDLTQPNISFNKTIPKGQTVVFRHGFGETGGIKLTFFCTSCGGPEKGPIGQILIVPREKP